MPKKKSSTRVKYEVGYCRPPKATQFAPGQSGNPKGRPKGSRSTGAILQKILAQKLPVTENGKARRLPILEVIFRKLANDALRGDKPATKLLFAQVDRYVDGDNVVEHNCRASPEVPTITPKMSPREAAAAYERTLREDIEYRP
jgi:hypothetical protein